MVTGSSSGDGKAAIAPAPDHAGNGLDDVKRVLGEPFFEAPNCLLYNMDCRHGMKRLIQHHLHPFDLTVTSPPYNIGKEYEEPMELDKYVDWCAECFGQIKALTAGGGAFWLNLGYMPVAGQGKAVPLPYLLWNKVPFYLMQEIVWNYGAGVACRNSFSPRNEKILWYVADSGNYTFNLDEVRDPNVKYPNQKKGGVLRCNPLGKNPSDVWSVPKVTSGEFRASKERTKHPAQFPSAVIERIIKVSSHKGQVVLDPFIGSGTTAAVALSCGRAVVGFEIKESYCQIAASRIKESYLVC